MKKVLISMVVGIFVMGQASLVFADGYEGPGIGRRHVSMGGTGIGLADDWTAIYWNPAGLTQLEGSGIGADLAYPIVDQYDSNSIFNGNFADMSKDRNDVFFRVYNIPGVAVEPAQFSKTKVTSKVLLPSFGGYHKMGDWTLAGGMYVQVGSTTDWEDTVQDTVNGAEIKGSYLSELGIIVNNFSIARKILPNLSLGAGLNLLYGKTKLEVDKSYTSAALPALNYATSAASDADGFACEWMAGILYKVHPKLSIGGVYRSGADIELNGSAKVNHSIVPAVNGNSNYTQSFPYASTWGIGLAFRPIKKLLFTSDWTRTDWTKMRREFDYDSPGGALQDENYDLDWVVSDRYHFGGEYNLCDNWAVRGGFYLDPSPVPDKGASLTLIADTDSKAYTCGIGYNNKNLSIDLCYVFAEGKREADGIVYKKRVNDIGVTFTYGW
ncbi:MAG: outer membrane protein transport protein [Candidatus Omnitrophica bacterium]|nr:outer membrane protein transport protein [Candidatus Omnitrophota bacterium]MBU1784623.1 outer membrane protein transport protein [Candidatus Omnitrophota bacterium]MBU1851659.1 outer membrane protein transport protein [Candidatus Omnitrophota bacterium]